MWCLGPCEGMFKVGQSSVDINDAGRIGKVRTEKWAWALAA